MVSFPVIDIPTAIAAVILSVVATFGKEELQRIHRERREEQEEIKAWLGEVVTLAREIQIAAMSHEAMQERFNEQAPPPEEFDNLIEMGESLNLDQELLDAVEHALAEDDSAEEQIMGDVRNRREELIPAFIETATDEFQSYYKQLKLQWASIPGTHDEEAIIDVRDKLLETTASCLAIANQQEIEQSQYEELFESAGELAESADTAIQTV
ncbi:hypothetical protein [Halosegnis longus]|uniref:hypothetical protein n=1 Tax=Halosegnis longus TaxID=2216012 RepID=UPI00129D8536|nr:hypothetical protein [Halosegnis longus]